MNAVIVDEESGYEEIQEHEEEAYLNSCLPGRAVVGYK